MNELIEIRWTEELEHELWKLFGRVRMIPGIADCSTPELLGVALERERVLAHRFAREVRQLIERGKVPALRSDTTDAIAGLRDAHQRMLDRLALREAATPAQP